jgi:nitrite reductase/ring-hydroxylating ferredoxin subunit
MAEYLTVARTNDLPPGKSKVVDIDGHRIALFNVNGQYFAVDDACPHAGGSLSEGDVGGTTVECPLHDARFDLATGQVLSPPPRLG